MRYWPLLGGLLALTSTGAAAQTQPAPSHLFTPVYDRSSPFLRFFTDAEWYFSVGVNKEYWGNSDIHVSQPSQGNDFTIHDVQGHDEAGFGGSLFGPQYNIRVGRFINDARTVAIELSFDHTKFTATDGQTAQVTGTIGGAPVNGPRTLNAAFFQYALHNGANNLMVNAVYRMPLIGQTNETFSLAGIAKLGAGIMVPHATNTILGQPNSVGDKTLSNIIGIHNGWWQIGDGWIAGGELGLRFVVCKPVYIELTDKLAYSSMYDLPAYQGLIKQNVWMNEVIFSVGYTFDGAPKYGSR
jgi:hypothetical protein